MSSPISVGVSDLIFFLKVFHRIIESLRKNSVLGFESCVRTHDNFHRLITLLQGRQISHDHVLDNYFKDTCRETKNLLQHYFNKIERFRPHLGSSRKRKSLLGIIPKIRWSMHEKSLKELQHEFEHRFQVINHYLQISQLQMSQQPPDEHFILSDANRVPHRLSFRDISTWEDVHKYLLKIYPKHREWHTLVKSRSYLFKKSGTWRYIATSILSLEPLRQVINNGEEIEMSALFLSEFDAPERCVACNNKRENRLREVEKCPRCGVWIHLMPTRDGQMDPRTKSTIQDMHKHQDGAWKFIDGFLNKIQSCSPLGKESSDPMLQDHIKPFFPVVDQSPSIRRLRLNQKRHKTRKLHLFRRVTLHCPQWPSLDAFPLHSDAEAQLESTIKDTERYHEILEAGSDLPMFKVAKMIGSRCGGERTTGKEKVLQKIHSQCSSRKSGISSSKKFANVLKEFITCGQASNSQSHPSVVNIRCFVWMLSDALNLEATLINECLQLLRESVLPKGMRRKGNSIVEKIATIPFILHVSVWRVTFDLAEDIVELFTSKTPPPPVLGTVFNIIGDSWNLCLESKLRGDLARYKSPLAEMPMFSLENFSTQEGQEIWLKDCQTILQSATESCGKNLNTSEHREELLRYWFSLE